VSGKGYIFTMDAALALIPIFIVLASVTNLGDIEAFGTRKQMVLARYAQDSMEWLSAEPPPLVGENSSLEQYLLDGNKSLIDNYLTDVYGPESMLYVNCSNNNEWEFVTAYDSDSMSIVGEPSANLSMSQADTVVTADRTLSNITIGTDTGGIYAMCTFRMYVWE